MYIHFDLKQWNKLHGPMHYKIIVTCVINGHVSYTLITVVITWQSTHQFQNSADHIINSQMSGQCSHAISLITNQLSADSSFITLVSLVMGINRRLGQLEFLNEQLRVWYLKPISIIISIYFIRSTYILETNVDVLKLQR